MSPERRVMSKTEVRPLVLRPPEDGPAVVPLAVPLSFRERTPSGEGLTVRCKYGGGGSGTCYFIC